VRRRQKETEIMYTPKGSAAKSEGIAVARAIASGDVSYARALVGMYSRSSRTVAELRAIAGACGYINRAYGANVDRVDFCW
jgi:hypothetical protein